MLLDLLFYLLLFSVIYFIIKRLVISYRIRKHINETQKRFHQKNNMNNSDNFSRNTKKTRKTSNSDSSIPEDFGEYTDYEELD